MAALGPASGTERPGQLESGGGGVLEPALSGPLRKQVQGKAQKRGSPEPPWDTAPSLPGSPEPTAILARLSWGPETLDKPPHPPNPNVCKSLTCKIIMAPEAGALQEAKVKSMSVN